MNRKSMKVFGLMMCFSVDYTFVDHQTVSGDQSIVTLQIALGF